MSHRGNNKYSKGKARLLPVDIFGIFLLLQILAGGFGQQHKKMLSPQHWRNRALSRYLYPLQGWLLLMSK